MARPRKIGLDYFPLQTDVGSDPKIMKLVRKGGSEAWTIFTWTLIHVYREGYYADVDSVVEGIVWMFRDIEEEAVIKTLDLLAEICLIDKGFYEQGIITSRGIQKQYLAITNKRVGGPDMKYWLVFDDGNPASDVVSESETIVSDAETQVSDAKSAQTKQKKIKENYIKQNTGVSAGGVGNVTKPRRTAAGTVEEDVCPLCGGTTFIIKNIDGRDVSVPCSCRDNVIKDRMKRRWTHDTAGDRPWE